MLGDRQGWMIEELMPRLGPRDQIGVQPCIAYLANLSREHVSRIQRTGSMPRAIETTPAKRASESWQTILAANRHGGNSSGGTIAATISRRS